MKLSDVSCTECGHAGPVWWFDASMIREREFEGLFFEVTEENGKVVVKGREENAEYLSDFNMKKITKEAVKMVGEALADSDLTVIWCPVCLESLE